MVNVIVLCAGFGTRLRPLTEALPKPLVPVGDRPLIDHILRRVFSTSYFRDGGLKVVVNAHHASLELSKYFKKNWTTIDVSLEGKILGTAGGVRAGSRYFGRGDVFVVNGDIDGELPLEALARAPRDAMRLAVVERPLGEGTVGFDEGGHVVRLRGERFGTEVRSGDYMGVMKLGEEILGELPEEGCLIGDVALPRLRSGRGGVVVETTGASFIDIGSLETYLAANLHWLTENGVETYRSDDATVASTAHLERCVILGTARVEGNGIVREVVALPGSIVRAPLERAIALADGRVVSVP